MNPCEIERHLRSMGYRRMKGSDTWGKPIGYGIYTFCEKTVTLSFLFCGRDEKIHTWDSGSVDPLNFLESLKGTETGMFKAFFSCPSEFQFLNAEEIMEL